MTQKQLKAAIYTRKSTEHGLDQDFNSLEAQREAAEAYIRSQRSEGWTVVDKAYDDGGLSGGNMERPALMALMNDIREGRVDIIVVYKVDRLTRSLADFAKIIEELDKAGTSFVSVTQQFNTSNSMGRLTLNVLLSFAQFEREVTSERIRDKIDASRKKGMWMGGAVPLGYTNRDRKLYVNESEANIVRRIYSEYLACDGVYTLQNRLEREGICPVAKTADGEPQTRFSSSSLYYILANPLYKGHVKHRGKVYPGNHEALVSEEQWEQVQQKLAAARQDRKLQVNVSYPFLLRGLIEDSKGRKLSPSHSRGRNSRYRYYLAKGSQDVRYPAEEVEQTLRDALLRWLEDPANTDEHPLRDEAPVFIEILRNGTPHEITKICLDHITRVRIFVTRMLIELHPVDDASITIKAPLKITRREKGKKVLVPAGQKKLPSQDKTLLRLVANAQLWAKEMASGKFESIADLARSHGEDKANMSKIIRLAWLAPDIIEAIIEGRQPKTLTANKLRRMSDLPSSWAEQRQRLGFI